MFSLFWDLFVCKVILFSVIFQPSKTTRQRSLAEQIWKCRQTILQNIQRSLRGMEKRTKFVHFVQVRDSMSLVWNLMSNKFILEESSPANLVILWLLSHSVWEITLKGFIGFTIAVILTMSVKHLEIHKKSKHEEKRFKCPQCDYQATQKGNKAIHKEAVHDGVIITIECKVFFVILGHFWASEPN